MSKSHVRHIEGNPRRGEPTVTVDGVPQTPANEQSKPKAKGTAKQKP